MELSMKVSGTITCITVEVNFIMPVVIFMRVNSSTIWLKGLVFTSMPMEASMLAIGTKISNMASEKKSGMTSHSTKGFIKMPRKRDKESTAGLMVTDMSVSGLTICSTAKDYSCGMTIDYSLEIGKTI